MSEWRSMISAPKDGTVIIAIFTDSSGVCAIRWGESKDGEEGWFECDYSDVAGDSWGGWIPCEQTSVWLNVIDKAK